MKAMVIRRHGGPESLEWLEQDVPEMGPMDVRMRVHACGVNHLDLWVRRGIPGKNLFPLPLIPGSDITGTVEAVGTHVTHVAEGDRVLVAPGISCGHCPACMAGDDHHCADYGILGEHRDGGYAEAMVIPAVNVMPHPANLSWVEGAAIGIPFVTAWHMLTERACVQPGEVVLVVAGGSGVGSAAIQIARFRGAHVIATASTEDKCEQARTLGAHTTIQCAHASGEPDATAIEQVRSVTGGRGADVVFEHVGEATWSTSMRCLAPQGRLVTCGATTGTQATLDLSHLFFKSQSVLGSTMGPKSSLHTLITLFEREILKPVVGQVLPMQQAATAHQQLEERAIFGKGVLVNHP